MEESERKEAEEEYGVKKMMAVNIEEKRRYINVQKKGRRKDKRQVKKFCKKS